MNHREFLKTTLPHLGLQWRRFRSKAVRRRIVARLEALGLHSLGAYRSYVLTHAEERRALSDVLTATISRFWRNRELFQALEQRWLPAVLESLPPGEPLRIWSVGCASGEEPYSLLILWQEAFAKSGCELRLVASDVDRGCLKRALKACYPASSLREVPPYLRDKYWSKEGETFCLPPDFSKRIIWVEHNLIWDPPLQDNHLIFCRNLAYTYFTGSLQKEITGRFYHGLVPGGFLVLGRKERLPARSDELFRLADHPVYERVGQRLAEAGD